MPPDTPVTMPVLTPIVATEVLLLVQLPPLSAVANVVVLPTQRLAVPVTDKVVTDTAVEAVAEHPPVTLIVTVYTPATPEPVTLLVGFCRVDVKPPGPAQL